MVDRTAKDRCWLVARDKIEDWTGDNAVEEKRLNARMEMATEQQRARAELKPQPEPELKMKM